ncbi:MAG TPA: lysophospholipid acyltransferase family protein [Gaiellaceae bacterium]|nr:lysophospholipid acyltransferase family protein [Gaiellaceae bacterium]
MRPSPPYSVIAVLSWPIVRGLYRLSSRGTENLPEKGGFVLGSNHLSNFDPWPLGMPLWPRRFLRFMAKSELYWWPLRYLLDACGAFPVRRGQRDVEAIETAVRLAREGNAVAMFPEGTRRRKGLVKRVESRPRSGAARIALQAGVPLVPAAVKGTDGLMRLAQLRVAYGPAIELDDLRDSELGEAARVATERLMTAIDELERSL